MIDPSGRDDVQSIVVVGAGGLGRETLEIFKDQNESSGVWRILGFVDDNPGLHRKTIDGCPVLGGVEWLAKNKGDDLRCICAIADCATKQRVVERIRSTGVQFCNAIHPSVILSESVQLGTDVILCAGSILTVSIRIGDHVCINNNSILGHDGFIGDYSTLSPMVGISGNVRIGEGVFIGVGAQLIPNMCVGDWSVIGAGAVVTRNIPERVVAVGVPARVINGNE